MELIVQVAEEEHQEAFYEEEDDSKRVQQLANLTFTIKSDSCKEMQPFEGDEADLLPYKARLHRCERGNVQKVLTVLLDDSTMRG
jgi:hypothetical protein